MSTCRAMRGASLIEVMVAVALLAVMMLAVAGSQISMMRAQRTMIWRERALCLADAQIERMRMAPDAHIGVSAPATGLLPEGTITIGTGAGGVQLAIVGWRDDDAAAPARCDAASPSAQMLSCVRIPFVRGRANER